MSMNGKYNSAQKHFIVLRSSIFMLYTEHEKNYWLTGLRDARPGSNHALEVKNSELFLRDLQVYLPLEPFIYISKGNKILNHICIFQRAVTPRSLLFFIQQSVYLH